MLVSLWCKAPDIFMTPSLELDPRMNNNLDTVYLRCSLVASWLKSNHTVTTLANLFLGKVSLILGRHLGAQGWSRELGMVLSGSAYEHPIIFQLIIHQGCYQGRRCRATPGGGSLPQTDPGSGTPPRQEPRTSWRQSGTSWHSPSTEMQVPSHRQMCLDGQLSLDIYLLLDLLDALWLELVHQTTEDDSVLENIGEVTFG